MALFQKIFSSKKAQNIFLRSDNDRRRESTQKVISPKLDKAKIRLVIYAESERGRTPFFDSDAIKVVEDTERPQNAVGTTPKSIQSKIPREWTGPKAKVGHKIRFNRLGSEVKVLEEMMFGTVALAFTGSTLKVHVLRSPNKLMLTKVFFPEKPREEIIACDSGSESMSLPNSCAELSSEEFSFQLRKPKGKARSIPVDVPSKDFLSDCSTDDDSSFASFTSSGSLRASCPSPGSNSLSSYNSLHKRWMRAQTTSLDGSHRKATGDAIAPGSGKRTRRQKVAIGIVFGSHDEDEEENYKLFRSFMFSHFALIEGHMEKLCRAIEKAYFNNRTAIHVTIEALEQFRTSIYDLYMAPRLQEPVWLTMMSATTSKPKLCDKFMKEFNSLVLNYDNKSHNFFVSTLLSAVLTQHLAWVATVTPADGTPTKTYLDKHTAKWIDALARSHPYNPLWAQLGDLYGATGHPLKISRTVVIGKKADLVKRFLYILSYFIRCSDVQECQEGQNLNELIAAPSLLEESLSPTSSEKTIMDSSFQDELNHSPRSVGQVSNGSSGIGVSLKESSAGGIAFNVNSSGQGKMVERSHIFTHPNSSTEDKINTVLLQSDFESTLSDNLRMSSVVCSAQTSSKSKSDLLKSPSANCASVESSNFDSIPISSNCDLSSASVMSSHSHYVEGFSELHLDSFASTPSCSLTPLNVPESPAVENVQLVNKAAICDNKLELSPTKSVEAIPRSHSFSDGKVKSKLTQLLAASESAGTETSNSKTSEIRRMFLSEGSSSMFDEYYEPGIEVKTIDALPDSDIMSQTRHPNNDKGKDINETETKKQYHRQSSSQDSRLVTGRPGSLPRNRSETSRRRHLSSTSSIDFDAFDPMTQCKELKFPEILWDLPRWSIRSFDRNFGRSLLAGYSDHYMSDFVLHGTSDKNFKSGLLHDIQTTVQHSILDEPIDEAVCVIADTDNWTVEVASSKVLNISPSGTTTWMPSQLVADLIESVVEISKFRMGSEFCLMTIEDRLQEIYFKSIILSEYLNGDLPLNQMNQQELAHTLSFDRSDIPLLLAVAGTHTPDLAL